MGCQPINIVSKRSYICLVAEMLGVESGYYGFQLRPKKPMKLVFQSKFDYLESMPCSAGALFALFSESDSGLFRVILAVDDEWPATTVHLLKIRL
jgi:hypothetical protein